jgi:type I restriction enzyme S subunit
VIIETPEGWVNCEIGEVTIILSGSTPPSKDLNNFTAEGGIAWITPSDLTDYKDIYISRGARNLTEKGFAACSAAKIPPGSILFSSRAPVGYLAIASNEVTSNQGFKSFVLPDELDSRFVYFYLRYIKPLAELMATGTTFKELSGSSAARLPLVIAPFNEQKRIANKLNTLLSRVDTCRERLDRIPLIIKRFRQAVLAAATLGQLTEDWRTSRELSQWQRVSLSEICLSITDGDHQAPPQTKYGIPFITISAINDGYLRVYKATRFVPSVYFEKMSASRKPKMGDILFSVTGSIGISALVDTSEPFTFQRHIAILKPDLSQISSKFLLYSLGTENIKRQALSVATGTAQLTIPLSGLKALMIDIPTKEKQDEIVSRIEVLLGYADRLEARYEAACALVERLTPALLAKAFRGELIPQDPNDEPASVLLERIRAKRAAQPAQPKRSPASRKSTMTEESVKEAIRQLPKDRFSFDELYENFPSDYNLLKDILFNLLNETEPSLTQVFDQQERAIRFVWEEK